MKSTFTPLGRHTAQTHREALREEETNPLDIHEDLEQEAQAPEDPADVIYAQALARLTGSTGATVIRQHRDPSGQLIVDSKTTYTCPNP